MRDRLARAWESFWYADGETFNVGLFRILFACCLLREVATTRARSVYAIEGDGFHLPYLTFMPQVSERTYEILHQLQYPLIVLLCLGLLMRFSCAALIALQGYVFFADYLNFRNHPYFFLLILLLLMLSPADESLSLRSILREHNWARALIGPRRPLTFQRLMQVQVCIAYFYAGLHKLHPAYLRGDILREKLGADLLEGTSGDVLRSLAAEETVRSIFNGSLVPVGLAWGTVILELGLPVALWFRRTRPAAMILGVLFHAGIAFFMDIRVFSIAMVASYLLFLDTGSLSRRVESWLQVEEN